MNIIHPLFLAIPRIENPPLVNGGYTYDPTIFDNSPRVRHSPYSGGLTSVGLLTNPNRKKQDGATVPISPNHTGATAACSVLVCFLRDSYTYRNRRIVSTVRFTRYLCNVFSIDRFEVQPKIRRYSKDFFELG